MDRHTIGTTDCYQCVWWASTGDTEAQCPYRVAATSSNTLWRQINTGRCTHFLAVANDPEPAPADRDQTALE